MRPDVTRWLVLDDDRAWIERVIGPVRCVFTDPRRGLTAENAERVVALATAEPQFSEDQLKSRFPNCVELPTFSSANEFE